MRQTHPNLPLAFNYSSSFKWNQDPSPFTFEELGDLGYRFIFITLYAAHAGMYATWNALEELVRDEEQAQWRLEKMKAGHPTESHHVMARVAHFQELERRYIPGARRGSSPRTASGRGSRRIEPGRDCAGLRPEVDRWPAEVRGIPLASAVGAGRPPRRAPP